MKVAIYTDKDNLGFVFYNENDHSVMVTHPDINIRRRVHSYLISVKEFTVPGSNNIGDRRLLVKKPCENVQLMEMGLCEMFHNIGVHVDWGNPDNTSGSKQQVEQPSVLKSIISDESFEIIN